VKIASILEYSFIIKLYKMQSHCKTIQLPGLDTVLHVGDRVCVFLPATELKELQRGRGGWSMRMTEVIMSIAHFSHIIKLYFCYLGASCTIVSLFIKIYFSFILKIY
jgi:hypothetical protein